MVQFKLGLHFAPPLLLTAFAMNSGGNFKTNKFRLFSGQNYLTSTTHQPDWQILGSIGSTILRLLDSNKQTHTQDKQSM